MPGERLSLDRCAVALIDGIYDIIFQVIAIPFPSDKHFYGLFIGIDICLMKNGYCLFTNGF